MLKHLLCASLLGLTTLGASAADITPTLGEESAYTLTEVEAAGENTITKYEYDSEAGSLAPVYYRVDLKETEFGEGDTTQYYKWSTDSEGRRVFESADNASDADVTYKFTMPESSEERIELEENDDYSAGIKGDFVGITTDKEGGAIDNSNRNDTIGNISGTFINNSSEINGGAIYNYASGDIAGGINGTFINNHTEFTGSDNYNYGGGAIYTAFTDIKSITGDFVNNYSDIATFGGGGAIFIGDVSVIENISGNFIGNHYSSDLFGHGGAINIGVVFGGMPGAVENITGNFIGNYVTSDSNGAEGGAIFFMSMPQLTSTIKANFIGNYAIGNNHAAGGAISAMNVNLVGDFIGNYVSSQTEEAFGGAVYGYLVETITGDFIANHASSVEGNVSGGAVATSDLKSLNGDFINNYATVENGTAQGGAISFSSRSAIIESDFMGNYASATGTAENSTVQGGAVYLSGGDVESWTGDFYANYATAARGTAEGGAMYNTGEITTLTGDFIENYTHSDDGTAYGGALYNTGTITNLEGDFIENYAYSQNQEVFGGAIYNSGTINSISGNFTDNYVKLENTGSNDIIAQGGAIYNTGHIDTINGIFKNNYAHSVKRVAFGGAIYNANGSINNINADFIGNRAIGYSGGNGALGSAILNISANIENINGNFIGNETYTDDGGYSGGAIFNQGTIGIITGDFIENFSHTDGKISDAGGAAIINFGTIDEINSNFIGNYATEAGTAADGGAAYGGAIRTLDSIGTINGDFIGNYIDANGVGYSGAIMAEGGEIGTINGDFINNYVKAVTGDAYAGALRNIVKINNINGDFIGNYSISESSQSLGGAIVAQAEIENLNGSFINNYTESKTGTALGGAIYALADVSFSADNTQNAFSGNYSNSAGVRDDNAIYAASDAVTLNFNMKNSGSFLMQDNIDGVTGYNINITGDNKDTTTFYMLNDLRNADLTLSSTTINPLNNQVHNYNLNSLTVANDTNFVADVDLANKTMDRFTAGSYGSHNGTLIVSAVNLLSDGKNNVTAVPFAEVGLKDNAGTTVTEAYTPIYKYNVSYENRDDAGYMLFARGGGDGSDGYNPAILSSPVTNLAAGQATINETFKYVFEHADAFTQLPAMERMAQIKNNYYALSTDYNTNLDVLNGALAPEFHNDGAWVRPYVTFETMNLKNGPDVDAITYGTLIGFDSDFEDLGNGWTGVTTGYVGYNGSQLSYSGNDTSMNGGLLGLTQTFYKGNFWTALTASAGASVGETSTMYGSEDFTSLLAGVGSKTGYNFEFQEGKFILQPIMFLSYTFVNTFDYTNAAGVKIESDPLHTLQLNPSVRFIANLKNGWQPYASVGMVWNLLNQTDTTANGVSLPDMHVKPYVEYGIGVQKRWADKFTAFFQTMIRNGGRNGVALTGGFRWSIGKDPDTTVNNVNKVKKVIKSRTSRVAGK